MQKTGTDATYSYKNSLVVLTTGECGMRNLEVRINAASLFVLQMITLHLCNILW